MNRVVLKKKRTLEEITKHLIVKKFYIAKN